MIKKLILLCLLGFSSIAMAAQCPPAASLTHAGPGADWVLDPLVAEQGWYISDMSSTAVASPEVRLSPDTFFAAYLYPNSEYFPTVGEVLCSYGDGHSFIVNWGFLLQLRHRGDLFSLDKKSLEKFRDESAVTPEGVSYHRYYDCQATVGSEADCTW